MAAFDFVIRQGDTLPVLTATMVDANGNAINLTGGSVIFVMRSLLSATPAITATATVVTPATGAVSFTFSATQTATAGRYLGCFVATLSSGSVQTFPADGYLELSIEENLSTPGGAQIVSLAEVKQHLSIPAANKASDARLVEIIHGVTPVVEKICGPVLQRTIDEWHDGGQCWVVPRHRPVLNLLACSEYVGPIEWNLAIIQDPAHGTPYSCMFDTATGRIVRHTTGGGTQPFTAGSQTVHVSYVAGLATVPSNIAEGTKELIRVNFVQTERRRPGVGSSTALEPADDETPQREILGFFVPGRVRELLQPSRRRPGLA
jgi:hypothetical protein